MKITKYMSSSVTISLFILTGCGGSSPSPQTPSVVYDSKPTPYDPCARYRDDGRNSEQFLTEEYCNTPEVAMLDASTAYEAGFTGEGVTVAVLDTGVNMDHRDLKDNSLDNAVSLAAETYDVENDYVYTGGTVVTKNQISDIDLLNSGENYTSAPTITVNGDGSGAKAVALLDDDGTIQGVYMTERGSGYTHVSISIDNNGTGGSGLEVREIYLGGYDQDGHGTAVSSIVAGKKNQNDSTDIYDGSIQGVAYDAKILPVRVMARNGSAYLDITAKGIEYAADNGAQVINMSLGGLSSAGQSNYKSSYMKVLQANSTIVVASGNDGKDCLPVNGSIDGECSFPAATPYLDGNSDMLEQDGGWIIVGSVDENKKMSWFSNKAGVIKEHYIVAYGEDAHTDDYSNNNDTTYESGTSFATPAVSGAMALLIQKYPHLTGKEAAQILFDTAEDLGEKGVDDVYGNGLLDIYAAFAPVGTLGVSSVNSTSKVDNSKKVSVQSTKLRVSSVAGAGLIKAQSLENTVAFDDFGRGFNVDMTSAIVVDNSNRFSFDNFFMFNYGDVILGADQIRKAAMVGYQVSQNNKIMFSADDTLLGDKGEGSLGFKDAHTIYSSVQGNYAQGDMRIKYQADYGAATAGTANDSLITHIDTIQALGGSVKAYYGNFGVGYAIPLTAVAGKMTLTVPTSREIDGTINYESSKESMNNKDYEQDASLFYELNHSNGNVLLSYEIIKNYGGFASDKLAQRISLNTHYVF